MTVWLFSPGPGQGFSCLIELLPLAFVVFVSQPND